MCEEALEHVGVRQRTPTGRGWPGEIATAEWGDWFNHRRPFEYCDDLTPAEAEQAHYRHHQTPATTAVSNR